MILGRVGTVATIIAMLGLPVLSQVVQPPSGGGSGSGTVVTGPAGALTYYGASGTAVSPIPAGTNACTYGITTNFTGNPGLSCNELNAVDAIGTQNIQVINKLFLPANANVDPGGRALFNDVATVENATVTAASTITPANSLFHLSGTTTVNVMTPLGNYALTVGAGSPGGCVDFVADSITPIAAGTSVGSFKTATTTAPGSLYHFCYTPSTALWTVGLGSGSAPTPVAFYVGGTSYEVGNGSLNPSISSGAALIAAAAGIPYLNAAQSGASTPVINYLNVAAFIPNPQLPTVIFNDGGANDVSCTTAGCITNYKEELMFMLPWFSIPTQYRIMGSAATVTGSWANDSGFPAPFFPASVAGITTGNPIATTTSGATATFNVPTSASTKVGVSFIVANTQTGTFSVSIDGTLATDTCSGTTTFSSGPCAGTTLITQTATPFRQEFTVTPNQTHTVVVTSLSAAKIDVTAVDWLPPSTVANINPVFQMNTNLSFNPAATFNTALASVIATLGTGGDGLPIYLVDQVAGSPGVNNTTDTATTATSTCPASTLASHPNDCGYLHMAQTFYNVEKAVGYVFTKAPAPADAASIVGGTIQGATISGSTGSFTTLAASGNVTIKNVRSGVSTNTDLTGSITMATGTGAYTFTGTYTTAPVCVASDDTAIAAVRVVTTTTTLTVSGTGADVVGYICAGRN